MLAAWQKGSQVSCHVEAAALARPGARQLLAAVVAVRRSRPKSSSVVGGRAAKVVPAGKWN